MATEAPANPSSARRNFLLSASALALLSLLVGGFAVQLCQRFYETNQPFYDSMAYHNGLGRVVLTGQERGLPAAFQAATQRSKTTIAPFLIVAAFSKFLVPGRSIGTWIQIAELAFLAISFLYYLACVRKQSWTLSLLASVPLFAMQGMYQFNGGLSDFRVDLSLCLMFAATAVWYLAAIETRRLPHFLLFGLTAGVACLFRATFPVYFLIAFGPLAVLDLIATKHRAAMLKGYLAAFLAATAAGLWFYVLRFADMYYYYFVWNTDANAHLPISKSIKHFEFVANHVGETAVYMSLVLFAAVLVQRLLVDRTSVLDFVREFFGAHIVGDQFRTLPGMGWFQYRTLWLAVAPTLMLVVRGAGLNPYVCMPSAMGFILFFLAPMSLVRAKLSPPVALGTVVGLVVLTLPLVDSAWESHQGRETNSMAAHQEVLRSAVTDAKQRKLPEIRLCTLHLYDMCTGSLESTLRYDMPNATCTSKESRLDGQLIHFPDTACHPAEADWAKVAGDTDDAKRLTVLARLNNEVDYLIIPDVESTNFVAEHIGHNVINRHCPWLREALLSSGQWEPITETIVNGPNERVAVYRRKRYEPATSPKRVAERPQDASR